MPNLFRQAFRLLPLGFPRQLSSMARTQEEYSMAFVTAPNSDKAKEIAGGLVSNKLAACVNIIPGVTSVYEWEGKIENDSEVLMMIKTRSARIGEMTEFVKSKSKSQHQLRKLMRLNCCCFFLENHPYDVCEVITTSIEGGNKQYLDWIGKVVPSAANM